MKPKISVIIPVYKVEQYIHRCVNSIINQTYRNLEIILVNDGSPDNSGAICDELSNQDKRIIVIHKENEGSSSARNNGLEIANGDYISFIDSDDWIELNMYEVMINHMMNNHLELVECHMRRKRNAQEKSFNDEIRIEDVNKALERINVPGFYNVCNKLYDTNLIGNTRFIHGKIHQDALFNSEIYKKIKKIGFINSYLYNYNEENESITRSNYNQNKIDAIDVMLKVKSNILSITSKKIIHDEIRINILRFLLIHYQSLNDFPELDIDFSIRKKIKKLIKEEFRLKDKNLYATIAVLTNVKIYKILHELNKKRIRYKQKRVLNNLID
ncbi:glycosyltransferase [Flavobacteriaceae bacterium R38]|nr:glycosyltransferase [Flavobacteriaceae bacterium R38]